MLGINVPIVESTRELRGLEIALGVLRLPMLVIGRVKGPLSGAALRQAAFRVQRRHPALRARLVFADAAGRKPRVEFCEPDPGRLAFEELRDAGDHGRSALWQQAAQHELERSARTDQYGFRIIWVPELELGGHVLVRADAALCDAISLAHVLQDLLQESTRSMPWATEREGSRYALEPLPPSPAALTLCPPSWRERWRAWLMSARSGRWTAPHPSVDTREQPPLGTHVTFRSAPRDDLLAVCRRHGSSARAALLAGLAFATVRAFPERPPHGSRGSADSSRRGLSLHAEFDLRARARVPASQVGLLTARSPLPVTLRDDVRFWDLAREIARHCDEPLERPAPLLTGAALDLPWSRAVFRAPSGAPLGVTLGPGRAQPFVARPGPFELVELFSASPAYGPARTLQLNVHELAGGLHCSLTSSGLAAETVDELSIALFGLLETCQRASSGSLTLRDYVAPGAPEDGRHSF